MKRILGALALSAVLLLSMGASPDPNEGSLSNSCMTTEDLTLQVEGFDESAFGNYDAELTGTITNTSAASSYEDVMVRVDYYNDMGTLIDSEMIKIHRDVDPGDSESFNRELNAPSEASSAEWSIDCAEDDRSILGRLKFWS